MADKSDYLGVYKKFFEDFAATVNPEDQLPVKVAGYYLCDTEIVGEIVEWTLQYLNQKNCPSSLVAPIIRIVIEETKLICKKQPTACGFRTQDNSYQPLKLMQAVTGKVNEVCLRYRDNGRMTTLPPPTPGPPISTCAIKNARRRMEDRHVIIEDFHAVFNIQDRNPASYYALFDGHAGTDAAVYSVSHLHQFLAESSYYPTDPVQALREAFFRTDALFIEKSNRENLRSGTTALCALLRPKEKKLYVAWLGDSQALLVSEGKGIQVVNPHKPDRQDERERIEEMGGCVIFWGIWRVNGQLAVSRAIGDLEYKPYVTAEPDVRTVDLTGREDFLILACDGLWDFVTEQQAVAAVYKQVIENPDNLEAVSQSLVQLSKQQGSTDNISIIVVFLTAPAQIAARPLDVPGQWPSLNNGPQHQAVTMDNKSANNPFTNESEATLCQKSGLLLDLDSAQQEVDAYKQNGSAPDLYFHDRPANGKVIDDDDDDLGPETDVDAVDDVQLSPCNNNPFTTTSLGVEHDAFRPAQEPRQETPTPPADEVPGGLGLGAYNVAESGEESEDEWNYYRVEPSGSAKEVDTQQQINPSVCQKPELPQVVSVPCDTPENMESQLNPNAAEFIPSPTQTRKEGLLPLEPTMGAISETQPSAPLIPESADFEISQSPELVSSGSKLPDLLNGQEVKDLTNMHLHINGADTETADDINVPLVDAKGSVLADISDETTNSSFCGISDVDSHNSRFDVHDAQSNSNFHDNSNDGSNTSGFIGFSDDGSNLSGFRGFSDDGSNLSGFRGFEPETGNETPFFPSETVISSEAMDTHVYQPVNLMSMDFHSQNYENVASSESSNIFTESSNSSVATTFKAFDHSGFIGFTEAEIESSVKLVEEKTQELGSADLTDDSDVSNLKISPDVTGTEENCAISDVHPQTTEESPSVTQNIGQFGYPVTFQAGDSTVKEILDEPIHISFELKKDIAPEMVPEPERVKVNSDETSPIIEVPDTLMEDATESIPLSGSPIIPSHDVNEIGTGAPSVPTNLSYESNFTENDFEIQDNVESSEVPVLLENAPISLVQDTHQSPRNEIQFSDGTELVLPVVETSMVSDTPVQVNAKSPEPMPIDHPLRVCVFPLPSEIFETKPDVQESTDDQQSVELVQNNTQISDNLKEDSSSSTQECTSDEHTENVITQEEENLLSGAIAPEEENLLSGAIAPEEETLLSGAIAPEEETLLSGAIAPEEETLLSGAIAPEEETLLSGAIAPEEETLLSGAIAPEEETLLSGAIAPEEETLLSGAVAPEEETLLSGAVAPEEETLLSGAIAPEEETLLSGAIAPEEETLLSGAIAPEEETLLSGAIAPEEETLLSGAIAPEEKTLLSGAAAREEKTLLSGAAAREEKTLLSGATAREEKTLLSGATIQEEKTLLSAATPADVNIPLELSELGVTQTPPPTPSLTADMNEPKLESSFTEAVEKLSEVGEKTEEQQLITTVAAAATTAVAATVVTAAALTSPKKEDTSEVKKDTAQPSKKLSTAKTKKSPEKVKPQSKPLATTKSAPSKLLKSMPTSPTKPVGSMVTASNKPLATKKPPLSAPTSRPSKVSASATSTTTTTRPKSSVTASKPPTTLKPRPLTGTTPDKQSPVSSEVKPVPKQSDPSVAKKSETSTLAAKVPARPASSLSKTATTRPASRAVPNATHRPTVTPANGVTAKPKTIPTTSRTKVPAQPKVANVKEGKETVNKQISSSRTTTKTTTSVTRNIALSTTRKTESKTSASGRVTLTKTSSSTLKTPPGKIGTKKTSTSPISGQSSKTKSVASTENRNNETTHEVSVITNETKCNDTLFDGEHIE